MVIVSRTDGKIQTCRSQMCTWILLGLATEVGYFPMANYKTRTADILDYNGKKLLQPLRVSL